MEKNEVLDAINKRKAEDEKKKNLEIQKDNKALMPRVSISYDNSNDSTIKRNLDGLKKNTSRDESPGKKRTGMLLL